MRKRLRNAPAIQRLMFHTEQAGDCWLWTGSMNPKGYGHIRRDNDGPLISVHRLSYEHFVGPIPEGLEIDHLCGVRSCVNPDHLEAVTRRENVLRGRHNQFHGNPACAQGHAYTPENTRLDARGRRVCRTCCRERMRTYRARKAA